MENHHDNAEEIEIDLLEIANVLIHKAVVIILLGVAFAVAGFIGTKVFMSPVYTSTTKMVVLTKENNGNITNSDLQASSSLSKDYAELIQSRTVLEGVINELGLDTSYEGLLNTISVSIPDETRIITISVTDENPSEAAEIADAIRNASAEHIQAVMDTEAVNVVDMANIPESPSSPDTRLNTLISAAVGVLLGIAIVVLRYMLDDTIKTAEDVEKYLGLSTLGNIPTEEVKSRKKRKKQKLEENESHKTEEIQELV